ncbi:hypothetical protein EV644_105405 [Kribbella orskensis]|uniref:Uncharacterized protein n=1 Tax=Kribbella orskensis TaxID=2512216 RepID=A0ABY2BM73_9ACTN|nr:hypothetical protein [Kribbella sp. VKM Ac-2500]TCN41119.1 hypothetical protein EV642_104405 [Kribbella sp. VKM Ac-2500]TCO24371.1 hypothetical protein EV644_105405 [Kribbella orskensis]
MNVRGYRVLQWDGGFDCLWSSSGGARYRGEGFDGLSLTPGTDWMPGDLEFLDDLPGLRYLDVSAKLSNDLEAFRVRHA